MPERFTTERLLDVIDSAGYVAEAYSGRGMYGRHCVSVQMDDGPFHVIADLVLAIEESEREKLARLLRGTRTDSMGLGGVVYWPSVTMEPSPEEDE